MNGTVDDEKHQDRYLIICFPIISYISHQAATIFIIQSLITRKHPTTQLLSSKTSGRVYKLVAKYGQAASEVAGSIAFLITIIIGNKSEKESDIIVSL